MFDPTRRDDLMPMRQIIRWCCIGLVYYGLIGAMLWALSGCSGGGSGSSDPRNPGGAPPPPSTTQCVGGYSTGCSTAPEPTCAGQGYTGTFPNCICPIPGNVYVGASVRDAVAGQCIGPPPLPTCQGQGYGGTFPQCVCPEPYQTYTGYDAASGKAGTCTGSPPPPVCPTGEVGTPPNCTYPESCPGGYWGGSQCECPVNATGTYPNCLPTCSQFAGATWNGNACQCPTGYLGTYPNCSAPVCNAIPGGYWGGSTCECPAGQVGSYPACETPCPPGTTYPTCSLPPSCPATVGPTGATLWLCFSISPTQIVDTGPNPNNQPTSTTLTWSVYSDAPLDSFQCFVNGSGIASDSPSSVGGYGPLQDGYQPVTVKCVDAWNNAAQSTLYVQVTPPAVFIPSDTFSVTGSDPYTFTWSTNSAQGAAGCSVRVYAPDGSYATLSPGGTPSSPPGGATSGFFTIGSTYAVVLYCGNGPDANSNFAPGYSNEFDITP